MYINTKFNSIVIGPNSYNGIDGSTARANQVPPKLDKGAVMQLTSKTTAVTLNKRQGVIPTNFAALAAGASAVFTLNNSRYLVGDVVVVSTNNLNDFARAGGNANGVISVAVKNETAGALGDPVFINFEIRPAS